MYNAQVKINDKLSISIESEQEVELFKRIARVQEVYDHSKCGKCQGTDTKFVCRKDKDENDWLEIVCQNNKCRAKLVFGQVKGKSGEIFPKVRWNNLSETQQQQRSDEKDFAEAHNGWLPNGGWFVYNKKD